MSRSFPSSRGSSRCPWFAVGGEMSGKNVEQRINITFCVKIRKCASETWALLTVAYGEYAEEIECFWMAQADTVDCLLAGTR